MDSLTVINYLHCQLKEIVLYGVFLFVCLFCLMYLTVALSCIGKEYLCWQPAEIKE